MYIFKNAFRKNRKNSKEIFMGLGFSHLSDVTNYYIHPNNQSYNKSTSLSQSIGEAIGLFIKTMDNLYRNSSEFLYSKDNRKVYMYFELDEYWRENQVVDNNIYAYEVFYDSKYNEIKVAAYNSEGKLIENNYKISLYRMLPIFATILGYEYINEDKYRYLLDSYGENPTANLFVNIHEDFYQDNKENDYDIEYGEINKKEIKRMISLKEIMKNIRNNNNTLNNNTPKEIMKFSLNEFSKEYLSLIPELTEEFIMDTALISIANAITTGDILSFLQQGEAGTGKTMNCKLICKNINLPVMAVINCTENLDEFVLGKYIPYNGEIKFVESYVTKAIRYGGAVVFEEINFAKPQYLAFLNSLLDDNGFVRLDNGEVIERNKNFRFFATMNYGYYGTKEINQSLFNRFNVVYNVKELSDEAIKRMLITRVPESEGYIEKILECYKKIKKLIYDEELDIIISPRNLENWAKLSKYEGYVKAAEKTILPIAKNDKDIERSIMNYILVYRWN